MVLVGEYVILLRKESASRIDQVNAGQLVLHGNLLGSNVLFNRDWVVCTTLVGEVVCDDHALTAVYHSNSSDNVARRNLLVKACKLAKCQERRASVKKLANPISGIKFASFHELTFFRR